MFLRMWESFSPLAIVVVVMAGGVCGQACLNPELFLVACAHPCCVVGEPGRGTADGVGREGKQGMASGWCHLSGMCSHASCIWCVVNDLDDSHFHFICSARLGSCTLIEQDAVLCGGM